MLEKTEGAIKNGQLLHRIIPTNSFLHKIKLKNTNLCTFCKIHDETIEHLFFDVTTKFMICYWSKHCMVRPGL